MTAHNDDALDRLSAITGGGTTAAYSYNGDGLRVGKTVGGATTSYVWDALELPVVLTDGAGYVWGNGLINQVSGAGDETYAHADRIDSIRLLTDSMRVVTGSPSPWKEAVRELISHAGAVTVTPPPVAPASCRCSRL